MKKHLFITVFSIILVVVGGGLIFLLMQNRNSYIEVKTTLDQAENRYATLSGSKPYPSPENISVLESNLVVFEEFHADLQEVLCSGEAPHHEIERAQFAGLLEDTVDDLVLNATNHSVMLPQGFYFGFTAYQGGRLPDKSQVERLVRQLEVIRTCSRLLFENRISSLDLVEREVFEEETGSMMGMPGMMMGGPGGMRGNRRRTTPRSSPKPSAGSEEKEVKKSGSSRKKAFTIEPVTISFTARDEQVWQVIDAITQNPRFSIIKSITMNNLAAPTDGTGIRRSSYTPPGGGGMMGGNMFGGPMGPGGVGGVDYGFGGPPGTGRSRTAPRTQTSTSDGKMPLHKIPRKERTLAGEHELVQVQIEVDVYQFCLDNAAPSAENEAGSS